jgi:hypothetical protein
MIKLLKDFKYLNVANIQDTSYLKPLFNRLLTAMKGEGDKQ